jgi:hypothetical protein
VLRYTGPVPLEEWLHAIQPVPPLATPVPASPFDRPELPDDWYRHDPAEVSRVMRACVAELGLT